LQIMAVKELVSRDESSRSHVYSARQSREATESWLVTDLLRRAFGGSAMKLAMRAISTRKASRQELREIRKLLDKLEKEKP